MRNGAREEWRTTPHTTGVLRITDDDGASRLQSAS